ncbi:MAG TPA: DNA-binding domain-containing protein [Dokdonella sp.]
MSTLAELQRALQARVLRRSAAGDAAVAAVTATAAVDAERRLGVYEHAYRARLLEVLGNDYPGLRALAGADRFERLGLGYVEATRSTHANVRWYGGGLADYARAAWPEQPAFAAMAELEWAIGLAFDAPPAPVVDAAAVAAVAPDHWPHLRVRLQPSLHRLALGWNVGELRRAVDRDEPLPALAATQPVRPWAVWRTDLVVRHRRLDDDEAAALAAFADGAAFAEVCAALCAWHAENAVAARAATLFRAWIADGWIAAVDAAPR